MDTLHYHVICIVAGFAFFCAVVKLKEVQQWSMQMPDVVHACYIHIMYIVTIKLAKRFRGWEKRLT